MDEPQSHPCLIVGLEFGVRAAYVIRNVRIGDLIDLRLEAGNPYDPLTVVAYHAGHHVGYIAPGGRWVAHSLEQGNRHEAVVSGFETDARDNLAALAVEVSVLTEQAEAGPLPPAPGMAPWAPRIVYAPLPRWPAVIPLGLLAGLAAGVWLLMERGFLPGIAQLAGGP